MGGTDDPSNLVSLTVEEHAEAHRKLYEKYGLTEDYLAWQGLSKQIGKEEILKEIYRQNGIRCGKANKGRSAWNKGKTGIYSKETLDKMRKSKSEEAKQAMRKPKSNTEKMGRYERSEETRKKLADAVRGKKWWNNGTEQTQAFECPEGWVRGKLK